MLINSNYLKKQNSINKQACSNLNNSYSKNNKTSQNPAFTGKKIDKGAISAYAGIAALIGLAVATPMVFLLDQYNSYKCYGFVPKDE